MTGTGRDRLTGTRRGRWDGYPSGTGPVVAQARGQVLLGNFNKTMVTRVYVPVSGNPEKFDGYPSRPV